MDKQRQEERKRQIQSDIRSLESDIRRAKEEVRNLIAMMQGARPQDAQERQKVIRNKESFIKGCEQRISELKRALH